MIDRSLWEHAVLANTSPLLLIRNNLLQEQTLSDAFRFKVQNTNSDLSTSVMQRTETSLLHTRKSVKSLQQEGFNFLSVKESIHQQIISVISL